eukprot:6515294-Prymnesium_polylepis.1
MFVRDGALCCHGGTPDGRLRCTWGRRTRSGEPRDRCGRTAGRTRRFVIGASRRSHGRGRPAGPPQMCEVLGPYGTAMSLDTRLGSWGGAMRHGGVAESARQVSIETAAKVPAIPRRGSGGYPSE